jgi:hypothetical protein
MVAENVKNKAIITADHLEYVPTYYEPSESWSFDVLFKCSILGYKQH